MDNQHLFTLHPAFSFDSAEPVEALVESLPQRGGGPEWPTDDREACWALSTPRSGLARSCLLANTNTGMFCKASSANTLANSIATSSIRSRSLESTKNINACASWQQRFQFGRRIRSRGPTSHSVKEMFSGSNPIPIVGTVWGISPASICTRRWSYQLNQAVIGTRTSFFFQ